MDLSCNFIHLLHFTQGIVLFGLIHATVLQQLYVIVAARFVPLQSSCGHSVSLHCTEVALPPSFVGYESSSLGHHAAEKRDGSLYFIKSFLWWHFQFGWTRTNQEVFTCLRGFTCFSRLTGMAPAQANDTHFCMAQERGSRCCFGFFPPFGVRRL